LEIRAKSFAINNLRVFKLWEVISPLLSTTYVLFFQKHAQNNKLNNKKSGLVYGISVKQ